MFVLGRVASVLPPPSFALYLVGGAVLSPQREVETLFHSTLHCNALWNLSRVSLSPSAWPWGWNGLFYFLYSSTELQYMQHNVHVVHCIDDDVKGCTCMWVFGRLASGLPTPSFGLYLRYQNMIVVTDHWSSWQQWVGVGNVHCNMHCLSLKLWEMFHNFFQTSITNCIVWGSSRVMKKTYCFFGRVFFQWACRIILGPPKHVLHLVWISTAIRTALMLWEMMFCCLEELPELYLVFTSELRTTMIQMIQFDLSLVSESPSAAPGRSIWSPSLSPLNFHHNYHNRNMIINHDSRWP